MDENSIIFAPKITTMKFLQCSCHIRATTRRIAVVLWLPFVYCICSPGLSLHRRETARCAI